MTESHLPPDTGGALPGASPGTSPMAVASAASAAGALILLGACLREAYLLGGTTYPVPPTWLLAPLLGGTGASIAAIVLGGVAIARIKVRRARPRGTALARTGLILGCAMLPLLGLMSVSFSMAIACHGLCLHD